MRSKGSRFTLGVWGLRVCSLDVAFTFATVRNRSQPFATVRNCSQPSARLLYGRAYGKFCRRVLFGGFKRLWQAQHFGRVHRHFAWQAQHFRRVVLRVFANRIGSAASSGDKVQIPWQAWHFVRYAEN